MGPQGLSCRHGSAADDKSSCRMIIRSLNATVPLKPPPAGLGETIRPGKLWQADFTKSSQLGKLQPWMLT